MFGPIFYIILTLGTFFFSVAFFVKYRQHVAWKTAAEDFGLQYVKGSLVDDPTIYGNYNGAKINVRAEASGSGEDKKLFTVVEAPLLPAVPMDMEVYREGFVQKMNKKFGSEDIQVGDRQLDDAFIIKGTAKAQIRELLTDPQVKARLMASRSIHLSFCIDMGKVRVRPGGRSSNAETLKNYISTVANAANAIDNFCRERNADSAAQEYTLQPQPRPQIQTPASQPAAGSSTVPFGRPAASGDPEAEPVTAGGDDDDWW